MKINPIEKLKIEKEVTNFLNSLNKLLLKSSLESDFINLYLSAIIFGKSIEKHLNNLILEDASIEDATLLFQQIEEITRMILSDLSEMQPNQNYLN